MAYGATRVNGELIVRDTIVSNDQIAVFQITPTTALTADTQASDGEITFGTASQLARELGAYIFQTATNGASAVAVVDKHGVDATSIDARATQVLGEAVTVAEVTDLYGIA